MLEPMDNLDIDTDVNIYGYTKEESAEIALNVSASMAQDFERAQWAQKHTTSEAIVKRQYPGVILVNHPKPGERIVLDNFDSLDNPLEPIILKDFPKPDFKIPMQLINDPRDDGVLRDFIYATVNGRDDPTDARYMAPYKFEGDQDVPVCIACGGSSDLPHFHRKDENGNWER